MAVRWSAIFRWLDHPTIIELDAAHKSKLLTDILDDRTLTVYNKQ